MNHISFPTEGIDPEIGAHSAVALASTQNHPVYWVHESRFRFLVKPEMTGEMVFEAYEKDQSYTMGFVVRCIDESIEDETQFMSKVDTELRSHSNIARFLTCCDAEADCDICSEEPKARPYQCRDGTFMVALRLLRPRMVKAVQRILARYPQIEVIDDLSYVGEISGD